MLLLGSSFPRAFGRIGAVLCALIFAPASIFAQPDVIESTLPEHYFPALKRLLESAVKQSPKVLESHLEIAIAEANRTIQNSPRLPDLSGDLHYDSSQSAVSGSNSRTNRDNGLFYRFELRQALFQWGALKNASDRARLGVGIAEKSYQDVYRVLALEIRRSYLGLVASKAMLQQMRYAQKLKEADLALERDKFSTGDTSRGNVYGRELAVQENAVAILRAETALAAGVRLLASIAGVPPLQEEDIPLDIPEVVYASELAHSLVTALLRDGGRHTIEAQLLELRVKDADLAYKIARVRNLPRFSLGAGHSVENTTNVTGSSVDQQGVERQTISVRAEWSIFDGFRTQGEKQAAIGTKRLWERRLATSVEKTLSEAQQLQESVALEATVMGMANQYRNLAYAEVVRVEEEIKNDNLAPQSKKEAEDALYSRIAQSAAARARFLSEWSALVSTVGVDPALKNIPARHVR